MYGGRMIGGSITLLVATYIAVASLVPGASVLVATLLTIPFLCTPHGGPLGDAIAVAGDALEIRYAFFATRRIRWADVAAVELRTSAVPFYTYTRLRVLTRSGWHAELDVHHDDVDALVERVAARVRAAGVARSGHVSIARAARVVDLAPILLGLAVVAFEAAKGTHVQLVGLGIALVVVLLWIVSDWRGIVSRCAAASDARSLEDVPEPLRPWARAFGVTS